MTNAELISKIKAEIERQRKFIEGMFIEGDNNFYDGQDDAYNNVLTFISSLESEKPTNPDAELEKEIERVVSEYSDKVQGTRVMKPSGVEKIARHFYELGYRYGFLEGAKIQREEDNQLVDTIYQQGIEKGKDDMKEQAVSGTLAYEPHLRRIIVNLDDIPDGAWNGGGTPVEVIMFKKEQVTKSEKPIEQDDELNDEIKRFVAEYRYVKGVMTFYIIKEEER